MKVEVTLILDIPSNLFDLTGSDDYTFFFDTVLGSENLSLISGEIGDDVGSVFKLKSARLLTSEEEKQLTQ